jgi:hypothetical protein
MFEILSFACIRVPSWATFFSASLRLCGSNSFGCLSVTKIKFVCALMFTGMLCGCTPSVVQHPMTSTVATIKDPLSAQMEFWHGLTKCPVTCNDDAFHGLLLFLDGKDGKSNYNDRVAELKDRKLIPGYFNRPGNEAVQRGMLAYAFVQALHIQGGWALTVFGPTPRYAVRELEDLNLYPRSSPEQTFSGIEFVGIIGRVEDYQRGESAFVPVQSPEAHGTSE